MVAFPATPDDDDDANDESPTPKPGDGRDDAEPKPGRDRDDASKRPSHRDRADRGDAAAPGKGESADEETGAGENEDPVDDLDGIDIRLDADGVGPFGLPELDGGEPVTASECYHKGLDLFEEERFAAALAYIDAALNMNYFGADICLVKGEILLELKRLDEALQWFEKAQELDPLNADVLLLKGTVFFHMRRLKRALSCFNRVLDKDPSNTEALLKKGMALLEQGDAERAGALLLEAADGPLSPERMAEVTFWQAKAARRLGRDEDARTLLNELLKEHPTYVAAYAELGDLLRLQGRYKRAEKVYRRGLARDDRDAALLNDFGNLLREIGDRAGSLKMLDRAIKVNPEHEVAYYNRALTYEEAHDHKRALADYRRALAIDDGDHDAHRKIAECLAHLARYDEALAELRPLLREHPDDLETVYTIADVLARFGASLESQGEFARAAATYRELIELEPDTFLVAIEQRGVLSGAPPKAPEAPPTAPAKPSTKARSASTPAVPAVKPSTEQGLPRAPHVPTASSASTPPTRPSASQPGLAALRSPDDLDEATRTHMRAMADGYRELAKRQVKPADAWLLAGCAYLYLGELREARACTDEAHRLTPDDFFVRFQHAEIARLSGRLHDSLEELDGVLEVRPTFVECYWQKAAILEAEPFLDYEGAIACYREGLERAPHYRPAAEPLAALYEETGQYERALRVLRYFAGLAPDAPLTDLAATRRDATRPYATHSHFGSPADHDLDSWFDRAQICFAAGRVLIAMGRASEAVPLLHAAARSNSADGDFLLFLGLAYHDNHQPTQAAEYLEKVVELYRDRDNDLVGAALVGLSSVALRRRDIARAERYLTEAGAIIEGDTREVLLGRAMIAYESQNYDAARDLLERVMVHTPRRDALLVQALFLRAKIAFHSRAHEVGLEALGEVLTEEPYSLKGWCLRAWLMRAKGDFDGAVAAEAEYAFLLDFLPALSLLNRERYVDARAALAALADCHSNRADVPFHLAGALAALGEPGPALTALTRAFQLDPTFRDEAEHAPNLDSLRRLPEFKKIIAVPAPSGPDAVNPKRRPSSSSRSD